MHAERTATQKISVLQRLNLTGFIYFTPSRESADVSGRTLIATDHVKRPRANPGATNVQAPIVISVNDEAARRTLMCAHGERLRYEFMAA